ncbi:MAG: dihydropteroate synthase [Chloroflexota bacterium]
MLVIANNLTTRRSLIERIFRQSQAAKWDSEQPAADKLKETARQCAAAGANLLEIDTQQHFDRPEAVEFAVKAVQQATNLPLCLSTNNVEALEAGLRLCRRPPLVNYVSIDVTRIKEVLPLVAKYQAEVVLLVSDPAAPTDAREMLEKAAILIGAANEAGVPSSRILVDPGIIHISKDIGQRHLAEVFEFLRALSEATEPPVRSTCWLSNISAAAPRRFHWLLETSLLLTLAGAGLSSVFIDVLQRENRRALRLVRIFNNELVYSDGELSLS